MTMVTLDRATDDRGRPIALAAKDGWRIPNMRPIRELDPAQVHAWLRHLAGPGRELVDFTAMYNCMGLVFGNRRTHIDVGYARHVLTHDGYHRVRGEPSVGDIVVYRRDGQDQHVGLVWEVGHGVGIPDSIRIRSKWGSHPDFLHDLRDVLPHWLDIIEFWTDRVEQA